VSSAAGLGTEEAQPRNRSFGSLRRSGPEEAMTSRGGGKQRLEEYPDGYGVGGVSADGNRI